jgi:hypothetical protein
MLARVEPACQQVIVHPTVNREVVENGDEIHLAALDSQENDQL